VITTMSLAQAKQLCHVDELADDPKSSFVPMLISSPSLDPPGCICNGGSATG
jgi:hypothetical protein